MVPFNTASPTNTFGQTAPSSSCFDTSRPACPARNSSSAKAFGANGMRSFFRYKWPATGSSRNSANDRMRSALIGG